VQICEQLKNTAKPKDYVISWWDYGYPLRYYADLNTLVDGGKHSGDVNFAPSFILSSNSQAAAAKLARLEVEYTEKKEKNGLIKSTLALMSKDYNKAPMDFLEDLAKLDISSTKKTRDVYLFLPQRMFDVFYTVRFFSNLDVETGSKYQPNYISYTYAVSQYQNIIYLADGNQISLNKNPKVGNAPIKRIISVKNNGLLGILKQVSYYSPGSGLSVIFMQNTGRFLILDEQMFNSLFVQLFVFENYDERYFKPVLKNDLVKIYKLMI